MKRYRFAALWAAFILLLSLGGCGQGGANKPTGYPVALGEFTLEAPPSRVVSLSPALTETLYSLGFGSRLVGVSDACRTPEAARDLTSCGTALKPNVERILELSPELVLVSSPIPEADLVRLQQADVKYLVVRRGETLEEVFQNYYQLCRIFSGEEKAKQSDSQIRYYANTILSYLDDHLPPALDSGTSAVLLRRLGFVMATGDTIEGRLLSDAGFVNQAEDYTGWAYPPEEAGSLDPDLIFCDQSITLDDLQASPYYKDTPAVKNERVYPVDFLPLELQSPRMFDAFLQAVKEAYPQAFTAPMPPLAEPLPEPEPEPTWIDRIKSFFGAK